ncbi:MAG: hypothetical protein WBO70_05135 [Erysipelotrichaceae bacterium]
MKKENNLWLIITICSILYLMYLSVTLWGLGSSLVNFVDVDSGLDLVVMINKYSHPLALFISDLINININMWNVLLIIIKDFPLLLFVVVIWEIILLVDYDNDFSRKCEFYLSKFIIIKTAMVIIVMGVLIYISRSMNINLVIFMVSVMGYLIKGYIFVSVIYGLYCLYELVYEYIYCIK